MRDQDNCFENALEPVFTVGGNVNQPLSPAVFGALELVCWHGVKELVRKEKSKTVQLWQGPKVPVPVA